MALRRKLAAALCLVLGSSMVLAQGATGASRTLVRAGHLLDVKTGKLLDAQTIVVTGDSIFVGGGHLLGYRPTGRQGD